MTLPAGVVSALRNAAHVLVLTGSGASAESGVPTFRDARSGLWAAYDPLKLATPAAFLEDPELVWRWYRWRRETVAAAAPNPGHIALNRLASLVPRLTLVTQNVDGLHQRAGNRAVIEFHGNLFVDRCFDCATVAEGDHDLDAVPRCRHCGGRLRPGVVWFGEPIPQQALDAARGAAADCDVFLSIGTSSLVWPAAGLAVQAANRGATVVEINPDVTPHTARSRFALRGKSGEVLPELVNCVARS